MIATADLAWIAGFLEGQGAFVGSGMTGEVTVSADQRNREPLRNLQTVCGGTLYQYTNRSGVDSWRWNLQGPAAMGVAFTCYRWLSRRRREQVRVMAAKWQSYPRHHVLAGASTGE